jgi:hypothetical protein
VGIGGDASRIDEPRKAAPAIKHEQRRASLVEMEPPSLHLDQVLHLHRQQLACLQIGVGQLLHELLIGQCCEVHVHLIHPRFSRRDVALKRTNAAEFGTKGLAHAKAIQDVVSCAQRPIYERSASMRTGAFLDLSNEIEMPDGN